MKLQVSISTLEENMFGMGNSGICLACGIEVESGCEPDAEGYPCESCGENKVMGLEQAALCGAVDIV